MTELLALLFFLLLTLGGIVVWTVRSKVSEKDPSWESHINEL